MPVRLKWIIPLAFGRYKTSSTVLDLEGKYLVDMANITVFAMVQLTFAPA